MPRALSTVTTADLMDGDVTPVSTMAEWARAKRSDGIRVERPASKRPAAREMAIKERRVVLRLRPYATFETPPRNVQQPDDMDRLAHGLGRTLPWASEPS